MHDRARTARLEQALVDLQLVLERHQQACRNLDAWRGRGYPGSSQMVSDINRSRGAFDPVGEATASAVDRGSKDRFELMRAQLDEDVETAALAASRLERLVVSVTETVDPEKAPPRCRECARVDFTTAIYADERCRWHYDFLHEWGEDAHVDLTRLHCERPSKPIREETIRRFHPDLQRRREPTTG